jgi:hypothetical protein
MATNIRKALRLSKSLLGLCLLALPATAFAEDAIRPGYWDYTTSTIIPGGSEGKQCVRPEQIDEFMSGPHNRHYRCTYPSKHVGGGQAAFDGECVSKHDHHYKISVAGTYSQTRFTLKGHVQGEIMGLPLSAPIAIDAKWIGPDCPAGAK